jgi:uncharacterized protein (TIGR03118 family)
MFVKRAAGLAAGVGVLLLAGTLPAAADGPGHNEYRQRNLVSDIPGVARVTDPNLVNPWGMSAGPSTPVWVSDADADVTTLYQGGINGSKLDVIPLVVTIPNGAPTGQVYNPTGDWVVSNGADSGPALFIFASESGTISGWNPAVPSPAPSTQAQVGISKPNAIYKGLAISTGGGGDYLYAANFHTGRINVFDGSFNQVNWPGAFRDPSLPPRFAPFNIQNLDGRLYVAYAKQDADAEDEIAGPHLGYVDVYGLDGHLISRLVSRGRLDAPWGLAIAPSNFGRFSGDLLVGNFGDGRISAYDPMTGQPHGQLRHPDGSKIEIQGLWGLMFGNGVAGSPNTLLFTAGIGDEAHGLMGTIEALP